MHSDPTKNTTSVKIALDWAKEKLLGAQIESPILDARLLLGFTLGTPHARFYGLEDKILTRRQADNYIKVIERRCKREPVSRIIGTRGFWNLTLRLNLSSLDPRPDSEILIESILRAFPDKAAKLKFIDFGTGTGCLLLSALNEFPNSSGVGIDISKPCIKLAQENAAFNGLSQRALFIESDWGREVTGKFDIIIANPPYIQSDTISTLDPEVKNFDPELTFKSLDDARFFTAVIEVKKDQDISEIVNNTVKKIESIQNENPGKFLMMTVELEGKSDYYNLILEEELLTSLNEELEYEDLNIIKCINKYCPYS